MAKTVFRSGEVTLCDEPVFLAPPYAPEAEEDVLLQTAEEEAAAAEEKNFQGPTAEELRREAEEFKAAWEAEKAKMIADAQEEAARIKTEAEEAAAKALSDGEEAATALQKEAQEAAEKLLAEAKAQAEAETTAGRETLEKEKKAAIDAGFTEGREAGFAEGKAEVDRLIARTQTVLERAQDKREAILSDTEQQIIDLVLLISRKVVKAISENQRNVVISNVVQALRKVKGRGNIIIRVNMVDLKLTTEHTKDFVQLVEGSKSIQVVEDSTVDPGGCVIETDFGEIDARISSQLAELETKILEISPIKTKAKTAALAEGV